MIDIYSQAVAIVFVDWDGITSEPLPAAMAYFRDDYWPIEYYVMQWGIKCRVYAPRPKLGSRLKSDDYAATQFMMLENDPRDLLEAGVI